MNEVETPQLASREDEGRPETHRLAMKAGPLVDHFHGAADDRAARRSKSMDALFLVLQRAQLRDLRPHVSMFH